MITMINRSQSGNFSYRADSFSATGWFNATIEGVLNSIDTTYSDNIGGANVRRDENDKLVYSINGSNIENIIFITETIDAIWNEIEDAISEQQKQKDQEEQEQEEEEEQPSKKK